MDQKELIQTLQELRARGVKYPALAQALSSDRKFVSLICREKEWPSEEFCRKAEENLKPLLSNDSFFNLIRKVPWGVTLLQYLRIHSDIILKREFFYRYKIPPLDPDFYEAAHEVVRAGKHETIRRILSLDYEIKKKINARSFYHPTERRSFMRGVFNKKDIRSFIWSSKITFLEDMKSINEAKARKEKYRGAVKSKQILEGKDNGTARENRERVSRIESSHKGGESREAKVPAPAFNVFSGQAAAH